ncbi:shikimate dehydrogenase [Pseudomonas sp. GX19020]|uniref:shikimate dehydrogenase family protein n=1 Tax=Pseudomonas sp. GX19020 TaxID=2942277 RepID=UPI0020186927|nr:shikimate dehydrogenase [Pseudomonas sp. GX19020]MCL4068099.1 shikimate dehydrogenase [Pseudomonas sp. GX19020]
MLVTGKSAVYLMIADPVHHTKSPGLFNSLFEMEALDAIMVPVSFPVGQFDRVWAGFEAMSNLKGMIVSVPFKKLVFDACQHSNVRAARVKSANAVLRQPDGSFLCDNFDGAGFVLGMQRTGHEIRGRKALLIGAGGAGSSLAYCLAEEGASELTITDVDTAKVEELAALVEAAFPACKVRAGLADPRGHELIVNATPMGLRTDDPTPLDLDHLDASMTVVDIIMEPRETPLLERAIALGCKVQYGKHMMECQMDLLAEFLNVREAGV